MSDEDLITISEAAEQLGLAVSTLSRQVKSGQVRAHKGGKVRMSEVLEDRASNIDQYMRRVPTRGMRQKGAGSSGASSAEAGRADLRSAEGAPDIPIDGKLVSFAEAQRIKENYLAKKQKLDYEERAGELGSVEESKKRGFEWGRYVRDTTMNVPARIAPLVAAEFGVDPVAMAVCLEKHIRDHLTDLANKEF